jgi:type IV pilus assembly protein PilN
MIRINLLPEPRIQRGTTQWNVRLEAAGGAAALAVVVMACVYYSWVLDEAIQSKQRTKQDKERLIAALQQQVKQVADFEKKKQLLEEKNRVIEQLERQRGEPVRTLDYVSQSLDPLKLWLVKLEMKEEQVDLEGKALSQNDIVEFANNLRRTDYFKDIWLIESRAAVEGKTPVYQFKISARVKGSQVSR